MKSVEYVSTRGGTEPKKASQIIREGMAPDGGLYVPVGWPQLTDKEQEELKGLSYQEKAGMILEKFLNDFTPQEIREFTGKAYSQPAFDCPEILKIRALYDNCYIMELWHGPTSAFKDMALQLMPHLLVASLQKGAEAGEVVILVATSGDTGKAALEGFRDVPKTRIIVFYPDQGVSQVQERQMTTQEGNNVHVIAVKGNFDDAQDGVKAIFQNQELARELKQKNLFLSSANSINWGRLVPQIVYYISSYLELIEKNLLAWGEKINIVVPTGNFGNILAAYYAKILGIPVNKLICAANANNVLADFINTGVYDRNRPFYKTISPSMDILISSNLERLLFEMTGRDSKKIVNWMNDLKLKGRYEVDEETLNSIQNDFWSSFANEEETSLTIKTTYEKTGYLLDPHTAVAVKVYQDYLKATCDSTATIIASTASPFKFAGSVAKALFGDEEVKGKDELTLLAMLSERTGIPIPGPLKDLALRPIRHSLKCEKQEMMEMVRRIINT